MKITGKTRVVGIFGDPIEQTLSPTIQNAAFESRSLNLVYLPFHVRTYELGEAVMAIRAFKMPGVNVTIPHKGAVIPLLDELSDEARAIGAVNTVTNTDGVLTGHNTDGEGYLRSLAEDTGLKPEGKTVALLGAGGAARAILYSLLKHGAARVVIINRTLERAQALREEFSGILKEEKGHKGHKGEPADIKACSLDEWDSGPCRAGDFDLLINSTSIGMLGTGGMEPPVSLKGLTKDAVVSDIVYKPLDTPLIRAAGDMGLKVHKGLGMLIHQGALAFELWTGTDAPIEAMSFSAIQMVTGNVGSDRFDAGPR